MAAPTGYVFLVERTKSRSASSATRGTIIGAARVAVLEEDELACTVRYEQVAGPQRLVGELATYPRAQVYITRDELRAFEAKVGDYWGPGSKR